MDIKVDRTNRIRLNANEVKGLEQKGKITQEFCIFPGDPFVIEINLDSRIETSAISMAGKKVSIILSAQDFSDIRSGVRKKSGICLQNFNVQIDLFSEKTRGRKEEGHGTSN